MCAGVPPSSAARTSAALAARIPSASDSERAAIASRAVSFVARVARASSVAAVRARLATAPNAESDMASA